MDNIVNYAIPLLVILIMIVVGAEVTLSNIRHTLQNPLLLIKASVLQIVLLAVTCVFRSFFCYSIADNSIRNHCSQKI